MDLVRVIPILDSVLVAAGVYGAPRRGRSLPHGLYEPAQGCKGVSCVQGGL